MHNVGEFKDTMTRDDFVWSLVEDLFRFLYRLRYAYSYMYFGQPSVRTKIGQKYRPAENYVMQNTPKYAAADPERTSSMLTLFDHQPISGQNIKGTPGRQF